MQHTHKAEVLVTIQKIIMVASTHNYVFEIFYLFN